MNDQDKLTDSDRRRFLKTLSVGGAALAAGDLWTAPAAGQEKVAATSTGDMPRRAFGRTGVQVSILGVGGHTMGEAKTEAEAIRIIHEAMDAGVNFMDNAWEYHDGRSEEWMGKALTGGRREKAFLMSKVCTHGRDAKVAMQQLEESLRRLQTDHMDLWQVHEVIYDNDPDLHFAKGGVMEAIAKAKEQGKVRFVGFTGHKDPAIHLKMLAHDFPLTPEAMQALRDRCAAQAADGRFELYKSSKQFDGPPGREQHGFPSKKEVPG